MELAQSVQSALARMLAAGRVEVRENGTWLAPMEGFSYDIRQQERTALLHLWSNQRNQVRRVIRIVREQPERLSLEVARLGRARPSRLEFLVSGRQPPAGRISREHFRFRLQEMLGRRFPDESIVSLTTAPDLEHSLSGSYLRGLLRGASGTRAFLAAAPAENQSVYDSLLTFGLIWLDHARQSSRPGAVLGLRLFFPAGRGKAAAHTISALSPKTLVELHEYEPDTERLRRIEPGDVGNVETWLAQRRDIDAVLAAAGSFLNRLRQHAADSVQAHVIPATGHVEVRYWGLPFARWQPDGVFFGIGEQRQLLSREREAESQKLLDEIKLRRSPLAADTSHPLYRAQPERWLEALIASDPSRVDARLDPRFIYSQVPALTSRDRGVMDLVGIGRDGRLAVLELKAIEDIHMPLQAVDYWQRVRWHHERQDFSRCGYFPGIVIDPRPPRLLMVAPSLRFHPATDTILSYLGPQIEIERIGLSEQWRRGVKVVLRQGVAAAGA